MKIFYFTGTGNSLYIAKKFGGDLYSIPQILKENELVFKDEKIGVIFPTYSFSIPYIVEEFISKIKLVSPYIFIIMTCGNNSGNATKWVTSFAKKYNIHINYSNSIQMIGNHIPLVDIEKEKSLDKHIDENINSLINDVNNNRYYIKNGLVIGGLLRNTLKIVKKIHKTDTPLNFSVNDKCIKCSTCIKVCPRLNVSYNESNEIEFNNNCESCLSCVNNCPQKAIKVKNDKNPNARFRNEHISLKEIIDSNNQQLI